VCSIPADIGGAIKIEIGSCTDLALRGSSTAERGDVRRERLREPDWKEGKSASNQRGIHDALRISYLHSLSQHALSDVAAFSFDAESRK